MKRKKLDPFRLQERVPLRDMRRGEENFEMWHDKKPHEFYSIEENLLDEEKCICIGKCEDILYYSDKWEKEGEGYLYDHLFTSKPKIWIVEAHASENERIGRPVKTTSLLGVKYNNKPLVIAQLGTVKSLSFFDKNDELVELAVGKTTKLYTTPDRKGLLMLTDNGPIIVRGGAMDVTSRGIVK